MDECLLGPSPRFQSDHARLRFILSRPLAHQPGKLFEYDSHAAHLLSVVLTGATGCELDEYARTRLFEPLGIHNFEWLADEAGYPFAGHGLKLGTGNLADIGRVMATKGLWRNADYEMRLLDELFVINSTRAHSEGG